MCRAQRQETTNRSGEVAATSAPSEACVTSVPNTQAEMIGLQNRKCFNICRYWFAICCFLRGFFFFFLKQNLVLFSVTFSMLSNSSITVTRKNSFSSVHLSFFNCYLICFVLGCSYNVGDGEEWVAIFPVSFVGVFCSLSSTSTAAAWSTACFNVSLKFI